MSIEWALYYAETRGWTVFPAPAGSKKSHKSAEHSDGVRWGATKNADQIRHDFARWSDAGIGIPTGLENGFWVLETDTKNGKDGESELAKLQAQHTLLPRTHRVRSPSGSVHYYFQHPGPDFYITSVSDKVARGVDVKADGGMVLAPPTLRNGKRYAPIDDAPIAEAPQWLLDIVCRKITDQEKSFVKHAPPTDEPTVTQWEIVKLERWVREALSKNLDWFAQRENALKAVWSMKRAGYGREGYRIAQIICEAFPETQYVARVDRFWNDRSAGSGTAQLETFWQMCRGVGMKDTPEEHDHWRRAEKEHMFDNIQDKVSGTWIPPEQAPPLAYDLPPPPPPGPCEVEYEPEELHVISAASFAGKPEPVREMLVDGLIPARIAAGLYGEGAVGKSLLALQLAIACVTNTPFLGRQVKQGTVIYLCCEDDEDEVHRRLAAICRYMNIDMAALGNLIIVPLADEDAVLAATDGRSSVVTTTYRYDQVAKLAELLRPVLVIGDTLADILAASENDRMIAKQFVKKVRPLAVPYGGTFLVLAHPSLSGITSGRGTSGSTGWRNTFRWDGYLHKVLDDSGRENDPKMRVLSVMKANYGPQDGEIPLRWVDGCYIVDTPRMMSSGDPLVSSAKAERVFLELLAKYIGQNRYVSPSEGKSYAPFIFAKDAAAEGVNKAALKAAMERLLADGRIENAPYGAPSKKQFKLYPCERRPANAC